MRGTVGFTVAIATLALAGSANAAEVGIAFDSMDGFGGYVPEYVADPGEVNQPTVSITGAGTRVVTFKAPAATISPDPPYHTFFGSTYQDSPCKLLDSHTAECILPDPRWVQQESSVFDPSLAMVYADSGSISYIGIDLGDRNDVYRPVDDLVGGGFSVVLRGGAGNDTLTTQPGANSSVYGGSGNDTVFAAGEAADYLECGDGIDHVRSRDSFDYVEPDCEDVAAP